jgi:hypothetical protein
MSHQHTNRLTSVLKNNGLTDEQVEQINQELRSNPRTLEPLIGRNGKVTLRGLYRGPPLALYQDQWVRLAEYLRTEELNTFFEANSDVLQEHRNRRRTSNRTQD